MKGRGRKGKKDLRMVYVREEKERKEGFELGVWKRRKEARFVCGG